MPAIKRHLIATSNEYRAMSQEADKLNENNDCAVRAISIATDTPYKTVHELLERMGRIKRKGTRTQIIERAVKILGFRMEHVPASYFIDRYPRKNIANVTTHHPDRFPQVWKDGHTYLIYTPGHILCVKDGVNHDWTRGRAIRATGIFRITKPIEAI